MILRLRKNQNFLKKFLNGPIRKVIMSKVKFGDLWLSPVLAIPDLVIFRPKTQKTRKSQISFRQPYEVVWLQETIRTKSYDLWRGQKAHFTRFSAINQFDFFLRNHFVHPLDSIIYLASKVPFQFIVFMISLSQVLNSSCLFITVFDNYLIIDSFDGSWQFFDNF